MASLRSARGGRPPPRWLANASQARRPTLKPLLAAAPLRSPPLRISWAAFRAKNPAAFCPRSAKKKLAPHHPAGHKFPCPFSALVLPPQGRRGVPIRARVRLSSRSMVGGACARSAKENASLRLPAVVVALRVQLLAHGCCVLLRKCACAHWQNLAPYASPRCRQSQSARLTGSVAASPAIASRQSGPRRTPSSLLDHPSLPASDNLR